MAQAGAGLIGPNAILQMVPVLERAGGAVLLRRLMARAGIDALPDGTAMIPEGPAARLHQALRAELPDQAADLADAAGRGTADYILAHRIPRPAQLVLRALPAPWPRGSCLAPLPGTPGPSPVRETSGWKGLGPSCSRTTR